jgi:Fur family peroxide stress response transcriptional regulator
MSVTKTEIKRRTQQFKEQCRRHSLPLTPQKVAIFGFLAQTDKHPTAEEVFLVMRQKFPQMSFATVYKNLKKFQNLGLICEIETPDGAARYDANLENHHHIINLDTKEIIDLPADQVGQLPVPDWEKLTLEKISVNYFVRNTQNIV